MEQLIRSRRHEHMEQLRTYLVLRRDRKTNKSLKMRIMDIYSLDEIEKELKPRYVKTSPGYRQEDGRRLVTKNGAQRSPSTSKERKRICSWR